MNLKQAVHYQRRPSDYARNLSCSVCTTYFFLSFKSIYILARPKRIHISTRVTNQPILDGQRQDNFLDPQD
jgi:hypothetical protein